MVTRLNPCFINLISVTSVFKLGLDCSLVLFISYWKNVPMCSEKCGFSVPAGVADVHDCKLGARIKSSLGMFTLLFFLCCCFGNRVALRSMGIVACKCNLISIAFWVPLIIIWKFMSISAGPPCFSILC